MRVMMHPLLFPRLCSFIVGGKVKGSHTRGHRFFGPYSPLAGAAIDSFIIHLSVSKFWGTDLHPSFAFFALTVPSSCSLHFYHSAELLPSEKVIFLSIRHEFGCSIASEKQIHLSSPCQEIFFSVGSNLKAEAFVNACKY